MVDLPVVMVASGLPVVSKLVVRAVVGVATVSVIGAGVSIVVVSGIVVLELDGATVTIWSSFHMRVELGFCAPVLA